MYQLTSIVLLSMLCFQTSAINASDNSRNGAVITTNDQQHDVINCEDNEYFHIGLGYCLQCTTCKEGDYTWFPCTNVTDTICGPKFSPRFENSAKIIPTETPTPCSTCSYTYYVDDNGKLIYITEIVAVVILTLCVIISAVVVLNYVIYRRGYKKKELQNSGDKLLLPHTDV